MGPREPQAPWTPGQCPPPPPPPPQAPPLRRVGADAAGAEGQVFCFPRRTGLSGQCRPFPPNNLCLSWVQVARSPLKEFDKEKAWRAVVVQMAQ